MNLKDIVYDLQAIADKFEYDTHYFYIWEHLTDIIERLERGF